MRRLFAREFRRHGPIARGIAVVGLANLLFLALMVFAPGDPGLMAARIRTAYATGELGTISYLWFDTRRGVFQHNDCLVLEMLSNRHSSTLERALAPRTYVTEEEHNPCILLRALVVERVEPATLHLADRFTRYWHGYNALTGLALRFMELADFRRLLRAAVWLSIGALALGTLRSGPIARRTGLTVALAAATVWGVQYSAPGLSQGPGDAMLMLGLAVVAARPKIAARLDRIVPYAAGFGAVVVFFEMFTGQLPTGVAWLAALTLAAARDEEARGGIAPPRAVLAAVAAFALGAAATVLVKQALALALVGPAAPGSFLKHLRLWMSVPESGRHVPGILLPFRSLVGQSGTLTFGSRVAGYALIAAAAAAWMIAAVRGWRRRESAQGRDVLILIGAALVPVAWTLLLPNHTYVHSWLMVRLLVVPISLAPVALFWPAWSRGRRSA
ncbi:MAG: hypothetical protein ACM3SU_06715 [Acidobacteriota bacterium]